MCWWEGGGRRVSENSLGGGSRWVFAHEHHRPPGCQKRYGRRRLLVAGCARSLCMSLAPIVAAAPTTAAASPRHSSRMRGAAAAAPRTSLRPCGRVRPRAERLPARSGQRDQEGPLLEPYSSYPSRASRGTLVRPVQEIKKPKYARPWPTTPACDRAERT